MDEDIKSDKEEKPIQYAGFWIRTLAAFIDSFISIILSFIFILIFSSDDIFNESFRFIDLLNYILGILYVVIFWRIKQATPGKIITSLKIVSLNNSENTLSWKTIIIRYCSYFISAVFFGIGYFWVIFDKKKQGWHDKLANTVVVREGKRIRKKTIFSIILISILLVLVGGFYSYTKIKGFSIDLKEINKEAEEYGRKHTEDDCLNYTISKFENSGFPQYITSSSFLAVCLKFSKVSSSLCESAPSIFDREQSKIWLDRKCQNFSIKREYCISLLEQVKNNCEEKNMEEEIERLDIK